MGCYASDNIAFANYSFYFQFLGTNPQLQSMFDMNPQLREMMQNPEIIRQLTSPEMMQVLKNGFICLFLLSSLSSEPSI